MSYTLQNPFISFVDANKPKPVGLGKLFVGLPGTDPEQFPVDVHAVQPDGTELLLSQPITLTSGGVASFNGSPVQLKIYAETVSIKVASSSGAQVYYTARWDVPSRGMVSISDIAAINSSIIIGGTSAAQVGANSVRINIDNYANLVVNNCWAAAIEAAASDALVSGVGYSTIWFNDKTYGLSRAPILNASYKLDGNKAELKANDDFVPTLVPTTTGAVSISHLVIFLLGNYGDITGPQRESAYISSGITLNCADKTANGLYIERMPYSSIDCKVINTLAGGTAIDVGPYCWGAKLDGVVIEDFAGNGITLGIGANGVEISSPRIWGKSKNGVSGILLRAGADCNGVVVNGGFIEKLAHGLYVSRNNGPISVSGTDFEVCTSNCIIVDGVNGDAARPIVSADGCYFDSANIELVAIGGDISASGCRFRAGTNADTGAGGYIELNNCQYESGLPTLAEGANVAVDIEQEFTPTLLDDSLNPSEGQTYLSRKAVFTRRKNQVFFDIRLEMSGFGSLNLDAAARIGGLPFNPKADDVLSSVSVGLFSGAALTGGKSAIGGYIADSIPVISLTSSTSTGTQAVKLSELTSSFRIDVSGSYFV